MGQRQYVIDGPDQPFLNRQEVAAYLGISSRTLSRWIAAGKFPRGLPGGRETVWRAVDVAAWVQLWPQLELETPPEKNE